MKTRKQAAESKRKQQRPDNFYELQRQLKATRKGSGGIEVQTWGLDASQQLVCCGPLFVPQFSAKWCWLTFRNWLRWRKWYDALPWNAREDYPAKYSNPVAYWGIQIVDDRSKTVWLKVNP